MKSPITGKTVVITGASSGIGRALALTLAKEGANLVLAARREAILQELASQCESLGANALAIRTDVTHYPDMENLVNQSIEFFGGVDVWVNNAGVGAVGKFNDIPIEIHEQVIKTDLIAYLYGAYAVLPHFKEKRKGIVINLLSLGSFIPSPLAVGYSASKFGLRGFSGALRGETSDFSNIHICDVAPTFVDTPAFLHAGNFLGRKLKPMPPVLDPFKVAHRIRKIIERPKSRSMIGLINWPVRIIHGIAPDLTVKVFMNVFKNYLRRAPETRISEGNIQGPMLIGNRAHGGYQNEEQPLWKYPFLKKYFLN